MFWLAEVFNGSISQDEMRRRELWARRARAEAVTGMFSAAGRGLISGGRRGLGALITLGRWVRRWQRRRAAIRELSRLSDRTLRDIGLHRGEIHSVVEAMMNGERRRAGRQRLPAARVSRQAGGDGDAGGARSKGESTQDWQRAA